MSERDKGERRKRTDTDSSREARRGSSSSVRWEAITEKTTDTGERVEKMEARGQVEIDEVSSETMTRGSTETDIMRQATEMNLVTRKKMINKS